MEIRAIAACLFLPLQAGPSLVQQQPPKAALEGVVVSAATGEPVADALLTLSAAAPLPVMLESPRPGTIVISGPRTGIQVRTDGGGRFIFKDLNAGSYSLVIQANDYVAQRLGAAGSEHLIAPITLTAGQALKDITVRLTPAANISGHVVDRSGEPLSGVPVQLLRYSYSATGHRNLQTAGKGRTNDRGEYRVYWITPGRYYLSAGTAPASGVEVVAFAEATVNVNEVPNGFGYAYYPGVADIASATPIELQPGGELSGVDLTLASPKSYSVRGRVVDGSTGRPPANATIAVSEQSFGAATNAVNLAGTVPRGRYNSANGEFEVNDLCALNAQRQPVPGAQVVVIPEKYRDRPDLFKSGFAGSDGRFSIAGISPDDYKLVAWETLEPYGFFAPELLREGDEKGRPLHVAESSSLAVDVATIPGETQ